MTEIGNAQSFGAQDRDGGAVKDAGGAAAGNGVTGSTGEIGGGAGSAGAGVRNVSADSAAAVTDFGLRLLQKSCDSGEGNVLLSPLSLVCALAMTANGARGETCRQMEEVFGLSVPELNQYLSTYRETLPAGEKYKLSMADAIWFRDTEGFSVSQEFLQANVDYFGAGLYKAPFDESTREEINRFVEEKTDGMVKEILDQIERDAVMYLVNALAFDGEWQTIYKEDQVRDGIFTREDGTAQTVELMHSTENQYLESEQAKGFLKYYADGKYAFAALLPREGVKVSELLESLTGEALHKLLEEPVKVKVNAAVPKFESGYGSEMSLLLQEMGMRDAFDKDRADFSGMSASAERNLYIGRVLHKTFIAVDEKGTKAGAATVVEMREEGAAIEPEEVRTVYLDRPFVYLIIDCEEKLPVFLGTMTDAGQHPAQ